MHREGHYGAALVAYAPIGFVVLALGFEQLAVIGGLVSIGLAMVPDLDMRVPFIAHRGPTHTVWFALLVGVGLGGAGFAIGLQHGLLASVGIAAFGFVVGTVGIGSHLLADALTPMGIQPYEPLNARHFSYDVTTAANPIANYLLLGLGVAATVVAYVTGVAVARMV